MLHFRFGRVLNVFQGLMVRNWRYLWLWMLSSAIGCGGGPNYKAASLPAEFRVAKASDSTVVNLSRLAGPGRGSHLIGEGDLLELMIATGYETGRINTLLVRVDERGSINVPLIGYVPVNGLEPAEAEQNIASLAIERGIYRQPYVTVSIKRQRVHKVTVVGAVSTPGSFELPQGSSDLLGALAAAGGLTDAAGVEVEVLHRPLQPSGQQDPGLPVSEGSVASSLTSYGPPAPQEETATSYRVNLQELSQIPAENYRLGDGDVVMVFPQQPRVVHIMGLVRKPDQFEIPPNKDVYLLDALALSGGRTMQVADKVRIIRRVPGQVSPIVIQASVRAAKSDPDANIRLAPGDLVSVEETPVTFVIDTLKSFIRFGVSASAPLF